MFIFFMRCLTLRAACLLGFALCLGSPSIEAQTSSSWQLLSQVQVTAAGVFLDQLLAGSETNAVLHVRLCDSPAIGRVLSLSLAQLQAYLKTAAPALASPLWAGPTTVQVTRRTRSLPAAEVLVGLKEFLQRQGGRDQGQIELRFIRPWTSPVIADEMYTLRVNDLPASGLTSVLPLRFELATDQESLGTWQMPLEVRLMREVWVAHQELRRGDTLQDGDLTLELRDALKYRDLLPADTDLNRGWMLSENVQPAQPVQRRAIQLRAVLQRGQLVEALYRDGPIVISLKAEVLDPGAPGQIIRLRNPNSRRELRGKIINEQVVQIQL